MSRSELPIRTALPSRLVTLVDRHRRLLALEFVAILDDLQGTFPEAWDDPAVGQAGEWFASAPPERLAAILREPALESWIAQTKALLSSSALRSCPQHHALRTLARLTTFVLHFAGCEGSPRRGSAIVLGGRSITLLGGAIQLRPPQARRTPVRWEWDDRMILTDAAGRLLAEVPRKGNTVKISETVEISEGNWRWERAETIDGVRVFSEPMCVQHPGAEAGDGFISAFEEACGRLEPTVRACLSAMVGTVAPACGLHPSEAASFVAMSQPPTLSELAHELAAGLVHRCGRVYRFDTSGHLAESLDAGSEDQLTLEVAEELAHGRAGGAGSMLHHMLDACESGRVGPRNLASVDDSALTLDLRPALERAGISVDDEVWSEGKSRDLGIAPTWVVSDSLLSLTDLQLDRLRGVLSDWPEPEVREFGLASLDYHEGRYEDAMAHLAACLALDARCEQYWLLFAFCSRHLRRLDLFEDIVFRGSRGATLLKRVRLSA